MTDIAPTTTINEELLHAAKYALVALVHMHRTLVAPYGQTLNLTPQIDALRSAIAKAEESL